jgi:hypothetical protein
MGLIDFIRELVDWQVVIWTISIGELAKRIFKPANRNKFRTVFWATLPVVVIYGYMAWAEGESVRTIITSFAFAYFLYPLVVKPLKRALSNLDKWHISVGYYDGPGTDAYGDEIGKIDER